MKLSESSIYKKAIEKPGYVIIKNTNITEDNKRFFMCFYGNETIWTNDINKAFVLSASAHCHLHQHLLIGILKNKGFNCSIQYLWVLMDELQGLQ